MKTLFDLEVFAHTVARIQGLDSSAPRQWGTMTPAQMLEHSSRALEIACGRGPQKQALIGKLLAWTARKDFIGAKPFSRNGPTGPQLIVKEAPDFAQTKTRLLGLLRELHAMGESGCDGHVHPFFGRMTGTEWGVTQFKHLDHHLRQFGA